MRIIDAHLHFSDREGLKRTARDIGEVDYRASGLRKEFEAADVVAGVVMTTAGRDPHSAEHPVELALEDGNLDCLLSCVGINPVILQNDKDEIYRIEEELRKEPVTGLKIYAGYFPYYSYDPVYEPVYELAARYELPVAIHCGDTSSTQAVLKYAHPLTIDQVAVNHQDVTFVICHMGDPWVMDTAEIISKNPNVYTDISGLIAGNREHVLKRRDARLFVEHFQRGLVYAERYDKVLFGTDWPLVPIGPYIEFIKTVIPEEHYEDVFYNNAIAVYPKLKQLLS